MGVGVPLQIVVVPKQVGATARRAPTVITQDVPECHGDSASFYTRKDRQKRAKNSPQTDLRFLDSLL